MAKRREQVVTALNDLDDRLRRLEELIQAHRHELGIQFQRIAQLQAEFDTLAGRGSEKTVRDSLDNRARTIPVARFVKSSSSIR